MGISLKRSKKTMETRTRRKSGRAKNPSAGGRRFEPLEPRQLYSAGTSAIIAEYINTYYETDAYGTQVAQLTGTDSQPITAVPGVPGALMEKYNDNGAIYWSPTTGAHMVFGSIGAEYNAAADETDAYGRSVQSVLGLPTSDEQWSNTISGARLNSFQGGQIDWSPTTGAHAVIGAINTEYGATWSETGAWGDNVLLDLGLPTADEQPAVDSAGGRVSDFQGGQIYWSPTTGAHVLYGANYQLYCQMGGSTSYLGLPTTDEAGPSSDRYVDFQGGYITFVPGVGSTAHQTGVSVAWRDGSELTVTESGPRDNVTITNDGANLLITADGQSFVENKPADGLFVYTRGGTDSVTINNGITARTVVDSIDNSTSSIYDWDTAAGSNVSVWADSTDWIWGGPTIHRVSSFAGGVGKSVGAALANPSDAGTSTARGGSLFGSGPVITDVNQGGSGDCYLMAELAGLALGKPNILENSLADLGDGTYAVEFYNNGTPEFVRVNDSLPGSGSSWSDAKPGSDGDLWAPVIEKAYAYFKTGANTYASINDGNVGQSTAAFNLPKESIYPSNLTDAQFEAEISKRLGQGQAITLDVLSGAPDVVNDHFYTLTEVIHTSTGNYYQIRNPWGHKGGHLENNQGYALLTYAQIKANFSVADITTV